RVQVLARELRQHVNLVLQRVIDATIRVAEVHGGVPHLEVEVGDIRPVVEEAPLAAREELRPLGVVDCVAVRAHTLFQREQSFFISMVRDAGRLVHSEKITRERLLAPNPANFAPQFSRMRLNAERIFRTRRPAEIGKVLPTSATKSRETAGWWSP